MSNPISPVENEQKIEAARADVAHWNNLRATSALTIARDMVRNGQVDPLAPAAPPQIVPTERSRNLSMFAEQDRLANDKAAYLQDLIAARADYPTW